MADTERPRGNGANPNAAPLKGCTEQTTAPLNLQVAAEPITVSLQGIPVPKGRPRVSAYKGRITVRTPEASRVYEEAVRLTAWREMRGRELFKGAVHVEMRFQFAPPASWSEKKKLAAIAGEIAHTSKPDCDNLVKAWLDSLNRIVFSDDACVTRVTASKRYSAASLAVATVRAAP